MPLRSNALLLAAALVLQQALVTAQAGCLSNSTFDMAFDPPAEDSCCMNAVCDLPCPAPVPDPPVGFGIAVGVSIAISFLVGLATIFVVHGEAENFFVCGHSLPLWIVAFTLGAQSVDSNALLGNADLSYKFQFYDGAVLPIGLGLSLIINGIFLARHINKEQVLTLPDILARRYGKLNEVLMSLATLVSFMFLLAGNLVGMGLILSHVWGISETGAVWLTAGIVWSYTVSGGLFSVAYTDVVQGLIGWSGCVVAAYYLIANEDPAAPPPSRGFPGYIYPDAIGDGGVCDMYDGIPCNFTAGACCYNEPLWCPDPDSNDCMADNGAYPTGDKRVFSDQMTDYLALSPFPNALLWNWATILILGFGNLAALDFQARCMAAKTPSTATWGCIIGGCISFFVGIPFAYLGSIQRVYYGPDSVHAVFAVDTCNTLLGLPTCAAWAPSTTAFLDLLIHKTPQVLGAWCLIGIVAASMSTADGAILALGTVFSHNIMRKFEKWYPNLITGENLLTVTRVSTLPFTIVATVIAAYYKNDNGATGGTGYLLIVAFDLVLATVVPSIFGCFYAKTPRPNAALLSFITGAVVRITLEFALPKDGWLLIPYQVPEFLDYGPAASTKLPIFVDAEPADVWVPSQEVCVQAYYEDYTGVDSLSAFFASICVFLTVQFLEHHRGPIFDLGPMMEPYDKNLGGEKEEEPVDMATSFYNSAAIQKTAELNKAVISDETQPTRESKNDLDESTTEHVELADDEGSA